MYLLLGALFLPAVLLLLWGLKPPKVYLSAVPQLSLPLRMICVLLALFLLWSITLIPPWFDALFDSITSSLN